MNPTELFNELLSLLGKKRKRLEISTSKTKLHGNKAGTQKSLQGQK